MVTSTVIPHYVGNLNKGFGDNPEGVEVIRLKAKFTLGQVVIANGIERELNRLNPDLVIVIGLGKAFPKPVFKTKFRVVSLFGDNAYSYANGSLKTKLLFALFKKSTYRKAIRGSEKLIAYTPESFEAAARMMGGKDAEILRRQSGFISLGFWPEAFYYSPDLRNGKRDALNFRESDKIIITATRIVAEKNLEEAIPLFERLPRDVKWLLVGSAGDAYAKQLEDKLTTRLGADRFKMLAYAGKGELNALYNAADLALYTVPAISIFEAIGTGLPMVMGDDRSLEHIVKAGYRQSVYRGAETDLGAWVDTRDDEIQRAKRALKAQSEFGWIEIAKRVLTLNDKV